MSGTVCTARESTSTKFCGKKHQHANNQSIMSVDAHWRNNNKYETLK